MQITLIKPQNRGSTKWDQMGHRTPPKESHFENPLKDI